MLVLAKKAFILQVLSCGNFSSYHAIVATNLIAHIALVTILKLYE